MIHNYTAIGDIHTIKYAKHNPRMINYNDLLNSIQGIEYIRKALLKDEEKPIESMQGETSELYIKTKVNKREKLNAFNFIIKYINPIFNKLVDTLDNDKLWTLFLKLYNEIIGNVSPSEMDIILNGFNQLCIDLARYNRKKTVIVHTSLSKVSNIFTKSDVELFHSIKQDKNFKLDLGTNTETLAPGLYYIKIKKQAFFLSKKVDLLPLPVFANKIISLKC